MELYDTRYKIRCEMGACKNFAAKTIKMSRVGIRSQIHICEDCLKELYSLIGTECELNKSDAAKKVKTAK